MPTIHEDMFNELNQPDPFEEERIMKETSVFVVEPEFILRKFSQQLSAALDKEGNLTVVNSPNDSGVEQELLIPFSLKNLKVLSAYPLAGQHNGSVFNARGSDAIFDECDSCSNGVNVYFMRKNVVGRGLTPNDQKNLVARHNFKIMTLRPRALFDVVSILESGTCPDYDEPQSTLARTFELGDIDEDEEDEDNVNDPCIGCYVAPHGVVVCEGIGYDEDIIGVVPGLLCGTSREAEKTGSD